MPNVQQQRQELRLVEAAWDNLALLSSLSLLSSKASANNDLGRARQDFAALSSEMMQGLATEALNTVLADLGTKAQVCIDIMVRNLFERSADIGFFATDAVVAQYLAQPDDRARGAMEAHLQAYASKYTVYRNILLFDTQGQCRAQLHQLSAEVLSTSTQDHAFLAQVEATPTSYVQDFAVHGFCDLQQPTLVYAQSVQTDKTHRGVLCLEFDLHDEAQALFGSILGDSSRGDAKVVLALVDPEGRVIDSSDHLQLPAGWHIPAAATAGTFALQHLGRRYVAVTRDTLGFQGYTGVGWRGLALIALDLAFDDEVQARESALMQEATGNAELLPGALRQIPTRSAAIQSALERSVWNGMLELNQARPNSAIAEARDILFAKTLLFEIGVTAQKTAQAFAVALRDLHKVVMASSLRDTQSRAELAMQILDRNLYERANDCRWWALTSQFASTLTAGTEHCALATQTLKAINALYTVYNCLVLFDNQGKVLAVSNERYTDQVGQVLDNPWVRSTLRLNSSQDYVVSALEPSRFYTDATPTYTYAAAVRDTALDTPPVLGGIAVVWDAAAQMQSILDDCAVGLAPEDTLAFVNATGKVLYRHGPFPQDAASLQQALETQESIVDVQGHLYGLGHARAPGYREFGRQNGYQHGLHCLALRHLCERQPVATTPGSVQTMHHGTGGSSTQPLQLATFNQGAYWLGLDASLIAMAAPDTNILAASSVQPPFSGMAHIQNKVYPVIDLRTAVGGQAPASLLADAARQLIVLQLPLDNGTRATFALRVDKLGAMLDLDRNQLQAINMAHNTGPSMIDAVVRFGAGNDHAPGVLCQLSRTWLQYCVGKLGGEFSAQDLSAVQAGTSTRSDI
jgi:chemotaxis signal transduction protein